jgi:hypothetical protein
MARRGEMSWPTPDTNNHRDGTTLRQDNNLHQGGMHGVSLHHAVEAKYGLPAQANPSTDGSRQESWATPRAGKTTDENPETWAARQAKGDVATMPLTAQVKLWPTITAHTPDMERNGPNGNSGTYLAGAVKQDQWATPKANEMPTGKNAQGGLSLTSQNSNGKLNPRWVETLMGLPVGWVMPSCAYPVTIEPTNSDCSEMASCLPPQSGLLES